MPPKRGDFIIGGSHPATTASDLMHGKFMTSTPITKRRPLPPDLSEFEGAMAFAGPIPSAERLQQLAEERRVLEQRMAELKARIKAAKCL